MSATPPASHGSRIFAIGASAGGVHAMRSLVGTLPEDFSGSVFVVLHTAPDSPGYLARILESAGRLPAVYPQDGDRIAPGRIYVAPPDRHLMVRRDHVHLSRGPKENLTRPAINPLFRSAARAYGPEAVGVVLTGTLDDGTAGLLAIEHCGGITVVQSPEEAPYPEMPLTALEYVDADHVLPLRDIAKLLVDLAGRNGRPARSPAQETRTAHVIQMAQDRFDEVIQPGASGFTCPECAGALWELEANGFREYECRIGHRFSPRTLLVERGARRDEALEIALRSIREEAELAALLVQRGRERHVDEWQIDRHEARARALERLADGVEGLVRAAGPGGQPPPEV